MKFRKPKIKMPTLIQGNETKRQVFMSHFDPNGSYTGLPTAPPDDNDMPEQDADDL